MADDTWGFGEPGPGSFMNKTTFPRSLVRPKDSGKAGPLIIKAHCPNGKSRLQAVTDW